MRRRELIIALCNVALASPFAIQAAAQDKHLRRVGILTPHQMHEAWPNLFATLRGLGYEEGRTINLLTRSAEGNIDRLLDLGKEFALPPAPRSYWPLTRPVPPRRSRPPRLSPS